MITQPGERFTRPRESVDLDVRGQVASQPIENLSVGCLIIDDYNIRHAMPNS